MHITRVLPVKKGLRREALSYFSSEAVAPGSLVEIPVRGKSYPGLVIGCAEAAEAKAEIKSSSFQLRKVTSLKSKPFLSPEWLRAVQNTAEYFAATESETLAALLPSAVLENISSLKKVDPIKFGETEPEVLVHQAEKEERVLNYKSAVRQSFARKKSVFIALPTNRDIDLLTQSLEKGIERYVFPFYSEMPKKELIKKWNEATQQEHPVLIIGSPLWLCLPRRDMKTIIIEKENASGWRTQSRPFLDLRYFVEKFAQENASTFIMADTVLRVETLSKYKDEQAGEFESVKMRLYPTQERRIIDMQKTEFRAVSPELLELIKRTRAGNGNTFIYATRKGLAPVTICRDCGEEVACNNCGSPVVLYLGKAEEFNIFRCHQCGEVRSANEFCKKCGSWRLTELGVGTERVEKEITEEIPDIKIFSLNKKTTAGAKQAEETMEKFYSTPGAVLLGTEMAIHYLKEKVSATAIASIDPLFFVPDWKIKEKIFSLVLNIRLFATETCLAQVRKGGSDIINLALEGDIAQFYKQEMQERENFQYPPFCVFIKITSRGTKIETKKEGERLLKFFASWNPTVFPSTSERKIKESAVNCVIKIPSKEWVSNELLNKLLSLPPHLEIKVNPTNLL